MGPVTVLGEKNCKKFMFVLLVRIVLLWLAFHYSLDLAKKYKIIAFHGFGINSLNVYMLWIFEKWRG